MNTPILLALTSAGLGLFYALKWAIGQKREGPVTHGWPTMHHALTIVSLAMMAAEVSTFRMDISPWILGFCYSSLFLGILANLLDFQHERNASAALRNENSKDA